MALVVDRAREAGPSDPDATPIEGPRRWARVLVGLAALTFVASGLIQAWRDAPTVDEGVDLAAGVSSWVHHDLRMSPEHPAWPKLVAAVPALAGHPIVPEGASWREGEWFGYTDDFLRANDEDGRLRRVLFLSRLVPLAEAVACGGLIFVLGRRLAGEDGGLLAAGLWFTTPVVLGLGHVQSLDMTFALATLLVALSLLRFRDHPTVARAATVGATVGVALLCRHTGLVLAGAGVGVVAWSARRAGLPTRQVVRCTAAVLVVGYLLLWAGYRGFDPTPPTGPTAERFDAIVDDASASSSLARVVLAVPAPIEWRAGFGYLELTGEARPAWLFGQSWEGGRWWYFPAVVVAKVPLGALAVLLLGPLVWRGRRRAGDAAAVLAVPALLLAGAVAVQGLDIGLRLVLPSLALLFVAAAPVAGHLRGRAGALVVGGLVLSQVAVLVAAGPHSLAWTPPPFTPAYRYVSDSNVDFGQDLWRLRDWSRGKQPWVAVMRARGLDPPEGSRRLVDADPADVRGWAAVGVTSLTVISRDELAWLRAYCPVGTLGGGGILLYRFDRPPSAEPGPDRPVAPCGDEMFSRREPAAP